LGKFGLQAAIGGVVGHVVEDERGLPAVIAVEVVVDVAGFPARTAVEDEHLALLFQQVDGEFAMTLLERVFSSEARSPLAEIWMFTLRSVLSRMPGAGRRQFGATGKMKSKAFSPLPSVVKSFFHSVLPWLSMRTLAGTPAGMLSLMVRRPWKFSFEKTDSGAVTSEQREIRRWNLGAEADGEDGGAARS
jgi:hypothetical protein